MLGVLICLVVMAWLVGVLGVREVKESITIIKGVMK